MDYEKEFIKELKLLGKRLKQLRTDRGLTLLALEILCGINDSDLSRIENGKEKVELFTVFRIAKALDVSLLDVFEYDGEIPVSNVNYELLLKKKQKPKN